MVGYYTMVFHVMGNWVVLQPSQQAITVSKSAFFPNTLIDGKKRKGAQKE
jgi:hypothetical protein